jgi:hypothetical protein
MRLSETAAQVIQETAARQFGRGVAVWLFGFRVRDEGRGGDIDLLVAPRRPPESHARAAAEFAAALQWQRGDQRIDVVIDDCAGDLPIAVRARETGRRLL